MADQTPAWNPRRSARRTAKRITGGLLVALPLLICLAGIVADLGWFWAAVVMAASTAAVGCVLGGLLLITSADKQEKDGA